MMDEEKPILVATFGNPDAGDDALGSAVAARLARHHTPHIHTCDAAAMLDQLQGRQQLIVVDAAMMPDRPPGTIVDLDWFTQARPMLCHDRAATTHGWSVTDQLSLAAALNLLPAQVRLIAMAIASATIGEPPHDMVTAGVERIVNRILRHAHRNEPVPTRR